MQKTLKNSRGFGLVAMLLMIVALVAIGTAGWYVSHGHTAKHVAKKPAAPASNSYTGWKSYSSAALGLSFRYPATWTVASGPPQCTGAMQTTFSPGAAELTQAASATGTSLRQYAITFTKYGTPSAQCAADGTEFAGSAYGYLQSTEQLQAGVFKDNWLTFFGGAAGDAQALPDSALVTDSMYGASSTAFSDAGTLKHNAATYQIEITTSSVAGQQYARPVALPLSTLKQTNLYKNTLVILNSATDQH